MAPLGSLRRSARGHPVVVAGVKLTQAEKSLQEDIVTLLTMEHILYFEFGKPGGHKELAGALPPGWPDLLIILPPSKQGQSPCYIHVELKVKGRSLSRDQAALHLVLRGAGCNVHVVERLEGIAWLLEQYGHPLRAGIKEEICSPYTT